MVYSPDFDFTRDLGLASRFCVMINSSPNKQRLCKLCRRRAAID